VISRIGAGGLAAALVLLLAGCSSTGPKTDGPFGRSAYGLGTQCFPVPRNDVGTLAALTFGNNGGPARISRVTLVGSRHLRIVEAWVVPIKGHDLLGIFAGYPPSGIDGKAGPPAPGVQWAHRQRIYGAIVPHIPSKETINLVLVLKPSGRKGTAKSERVYYHSGGTNYVLNLGVGIQIINGQRSC
jgi:hypothetical protein